MIKKHKSLILLSSLIILIPMVIGLLLWDRLPDPLPMHWNAAGEIDGYGSRGMAVFFLPLFILGMHWFCILMTSLDPNNADIGGKSLQLVMWICPFMSLLACSFVYATALGHSVSISTIMPLPLGAMFLVIGNFLPKCKRNYIMGIKLPWTLASEANWNATHRFGGKVWVIGGILTMLTAFRGSFWLMMVILVIMVILPTVYSYLYYHNHEQEKSDGN